MNPNLLGIFSAALTLAAFSITYRIAKSKTPKSRAILGLVAFLFSIPAVSFSVYYTHILPETSWYYQFRSIPGTELLLVPLGVFGGLAATFLPRVLLIMPLLAVAVLSIVPFIKPFLGPLPEGQLKDKWDNNICLQSTSSTCGAASLASSLKHLGIEVTETEIAVDAHSYRGGTEAWYLARAARSRDAEATFDFSTTFNPNRGLPAVVGVLLGSAGHFIAILGKDGDNFIVGDPLYGHELLSLEELMSRYTFTGFHLRLN
ncbi:cysteine peptidase family C39 domain-containing protein [Rubritalea marina]|uniref:cysteine peptidase family C39 domain-containing protein n=1 Tax=Rubritalea marina TaxID=361055 RepID=UPI00037A8B03|nr:cysteine peptidase family C39 domain-containing protein [Rubritalea marina]